jgi:hypothetical protein
VFCGVVLRRICIENSDRRLAYTYAYASFGELLRWIIGWILVEYAIGNIAVAISVERLFHKPPGTNGIHIPLNWTMDYRTASLGYATVQEAVAGGTTVEALQAGCTAADAAITCGQMDAYHGLCDGPAGERMADRRRPSRARIVVLITGACVRGHTRIEDGVEHYGRSQTRSNFNGDRRRRILYQHRQLDPVHAQRFGGVMSGVAAVFFAYIGFDASSTNSRRVQGSIQDAPARNDLFADSSATVLYVPSRVVLDRNGSSSHNALRSAIRCVRVSAGGASICQWMSGNNRRCRLSWP